VTRTGKNTPGIHVCGPTRSRPRRRKVATWIRARAGLLRSRPAYRAPSIGVIRGRWPRNSLWFTSRIFHRHSQQFEQKTASTHRGNVAEIVLNLRPDAPLQLLLELIAQAVDLPFDVYGKFSISHFK